MGQSRGEPRASPIWPLEVRRHVWLKGNLHTHTTNSDGDSPPNVVVRWYAEHGYDFLALTDHNIFTDPRTVDPGALGDLFLIGGEEVTMELGVHVNALNITGCIAPPRLGPAPYVMDSRPGREEDKRRLLREALRAIAQRGGLASVNHPNRDWNLDHGVLQPVEGLAFFEVFNGGAASRNDGDCAHLSTGRLWDRLLTSGRRIYALATDDAHSFETWKPLAANPGRGWVMVDAEERAPRAVANALERGRFYATTGVVLESVEVRRGRLELAVRPDRRAHYWIEFIGNRGEVLDCSEALWAGLDLPPGRSYLRATVRASNGTRAWLQPLFRA